jgi:hypothetical protein
MRKTENVAVTGAGTAWGSQHRSGRTPNCFRIAPKLANVPARSASDQLISEERIKAPIQGSFVLCRLNPPDKPFFSVVGQR